MGLNDLLFLGVWSLAGFIAGFVYIHLAKTINSSKMSVGLFILLYFGPAIFFVVSMGFASGHSFLVLQGILLFLLTFKQFVSYSIGFIIGIIVGNRKKTGKV